MAAGSVSLSWYAQPVWTFLAGAIAALTLFFTLWWHYRPEGGAISYGASITPIVANIPGKPSELRVMYDSIELAHAEFVQVYVRNTGSGPISRRDFDGPLTISLAHARIVSARVGETIPSNLPVSIQTPDSARVLVSPLLLNPGDQLAISIIAAGNVPNVSVSGRVLGVTNVEFAPDLFGQHSGGSTEYLIGALSAIAATLLGKFTSSLLYRIASNRKVRRLAQKPSDAESS